METPEQIKTEISQIKPEKQRRSEAMRKWAEEILAQNSFDEESFDRMSEYYSNLSVGEKASLLYEKLLICYSTKKESTKSESEPLFSPRFISGIRALWNDEKVRNIFLDKFPESRMELKKYRESPIGKEWQNIAKQLEYKTKEYEEISKELFIKKFSRPDEVSAIKDDEGSLALEMIELHNKEKNIQSLSGMNKTPENTDALARINYGIIKKYNKELKSGFVWTPSTQKDLQIIIQQSNNG